MIGEHITTTPLLGSSSGNHFNGKPSISNPRNAKISKITAWGQDFVGCLKLEYDNGNNVVEHGTGKGGTQTVITLAPDECIVTVEGDFGGGALSRLRFTTSKGTAHGPIGYYDSGGPTFTWNSSSFAVSTEIGKSLGLFYFTGTSSHYIWSLQAVFSQCRRNEGSPAVKYERQAPGDPGAATEDMALLSGFTRNIMSPIVTLLVGPTQNVFHVYEKIVCRLPFFTAALNGQFREASHKRISMPEDDPSSIAALVEFLYNGHYTYPYISEDESPSPEAPTVDRVEGAFHIGVYVAASKYDCEELSKAAIVSLANVLIGLEGIEIVRLWKEAYQSGLNLDHVKDFPELKSKMVSMLKEVYSEHKEEMAMTVKDIPELGNDLLKLIVEHATF